MIIEAGMSMIFIQWAREYPKYKFWVQPERAAAVGIEEATAISSLRRQTDGELACMQHFFVLSCVCSLFMMEPLFRGFWSMQHQHIELPKCTVWSLPKTSNVVWVVRHRQLFLTSSISSRLALSRDPVSSFKDLGWIHEHFAGSPLEHYCRFACRRVNTTNVGPYGPIWMQFITC